MLVHHNIQKVTKQQPAQQLATPQQQEVVTADGNEDIQNFIYRYENRDLPIASFEKRLLKSRFGDQSEVRLSDLKDNFHSKLPRLKRALYNEVTKQGFFAHSPEAPKRFTCILVV